MNSPENTAAIKKSVRTSHRAMLTWCVLSTGIYWISGGEFVRCPALGWLVAVVIIGALILGVLVLAAADYSMAKNQPHNQ